MQTFLPYPNLWDSLACLDKKRMGNQRREAITLINIEIRATGKGWYNHPASRMWRGYLPALKLYHDVSIAVWIYHGGKNTMEMFGDPTRDEIMPPWFGRADIHESHQSNLLRKMPEHYGRFGWSVPDNLPYIWPGIPA